MGKKWKRKGSDGAKGGAPLLSVGMIFKNEIRCLERCMKSLQPLRETIPCQLVMADTGSDDGSREIAEKYADVLFDFPWVDDFSAARNAVFDRCKGQWTLALDCDEWLDDITELVSFLKEANSPRFAHFNGGTVIQRNYKSEDLKSLYIDFSASRLFRMRVHPRYVGAIHEYVAVSDALTLSETILHHDGYLNMNSEEGQARRNRNLKLLRQELEREPDNLRRILQYMESGYDQPDYLEKMKLGVELSERKLPEWEFFGPRIFSYAVEEAFKRDFPQMSEWAQKAETLFPESYRTRIDISFWLCQYFYGQEDYQESARMGERYLKARSDFETDRQALRESRVGGFPLREERCEQLTRSILLSCYLRLGRAQDAADMLKAVKMNRAPESSLSILLNAMGEMRRDTDDDFSPLILALWDSLNAPMSSDETPEGRKETFLRVGESILHDSLRDTTPHPAYTLFAPLAGKCPLGDKAALMTLTAPDALSEILARQEDVSSLPAPVLLRAISCGAEFPTPDRPLTPEEMGALCQSLRGEGDACVSLALDCSQADFASDWQSLLWTDALLFAALGACDWTAGPRRYELFRAFAAVERTFLSRYYAPDALESPSILPYRHRFGWHCAKAVELLDAGDFAGAVSNLRDALKQDSRMKPVTEFALDEIVRQEREWRIAHTSPELLDMAERIRQILVALPSDSPEVKRLKESSAYRQLAWLIET